MIITNASLKTGNLLKKLSFLVSYLLNQIKYFRKTLIVHLFLHQ